MRNRNKTLNKDSLWQLRQEIVLGSIYIRDYKNSFDIPEEVCFAFFDGFLDDCWDIENELENGITEVDELYAKYDNAEALWNYFCGVE